MKRCLIIAVLMLVVIGARGQVFVGADAAYNYTNYQGTEGFSTEQPRGKSFNFAPQVGYRFNDVVSVGVRMGIGNSIATYSTGYYNPSTMAWDTSSFNDYTHAGMSAAAFVRFCCARTGSFTFNLEVSGAYSYEINGDARTEFAASYFRRLVVLKQRQGMQGFEARLRPYVTYEINKHLEVELFADCLSLYASRMTVTKWKAADGDSKPEEVLVDNRGVQSSAGIGLNMQGASPLSIGVSYIF